MSENLEFEVGLGEFIDDLPSNVKNAYKKSETPKSKEELAIFYFLNICAFEMCKNEVVGADALKAMRSIVAALAICQVISVEFHGMLKDSYRESDVEPAVQALNDIISVLDVLLFVAPDKVSEKREQVGKSVLKSGADLMSSSDEGLKKYLEIITSTAGAYICKFENDDGSRVTDENLFGLLVKIHQMLLASAEA